MPDAAQAETADDVLVLGTGLSDNHGHTRSAELTR